jgi:DNA-binding transcriptional MerR regulator
MTGMREARDVLWGLDELCAQVALALAVDYAGQASGRVRDVPDRRTIRYYTTLGLLDRPLATPGRGRTAFYGRRHLLQLVAIKRLQAQGLSLSEVQQRLMGQTDAVLEEVARLPATGAASSPASGPEAAGQDRRAGAFWKSEPAAPAPALLGAPLGEGVTLLFRAARALEGADLEALQAAARPLVKVLEARRLLAKDER